ncbi:hypothetical protein D3C81_889260 [compost metagenome]
MSFLIQHLTANRFEIDNGRLISSPDRKRNLHFRVPGNGLLIEFRCDLHRSANIGAVLHELIESHCYFIRVVIYTERSGFIQSGVRNVIIKLEFLRDNELESISTFVTMTILKCPVILEGYCRANLYAAFLVRVNCGVNDGTRLILQYNLSQDIGLIHGYILLDSRWIN